ncbi:hypothetical protein FK220_017815 [Flavobacteriaceae bacterium TP-CH-4]|uniref:Uncharacterized protein n=1 Tax=Pelagihabitans pacificus TaxID=2696054 RepID=A0A967AVL9_9FLAO|nr:hypothetical protein [Pelagihabitans pacificus]NHF61214.1 hypothetical protein [Pelagihabitans pacificus]
MKRLLFICWPLLLLNCDDGDLQIETLDFDSVDPQSCETVVVEAENVLFKINDDEALILELAANTLKNEVDVDTVEIGSSQPANIVYRIFSDQVDTDYFCASIPPTSPVVIDEIPAENGLIRITTTTEDSITFSHQINITEISLIISESNRITDLSISEFGTVTTTKPEDQGN